MKWQAMRERWRTRAQSQWLAIPPDLRPWLFDRGSLTQRLREACDGRVQVRVLRCGQALVSNAERAALGLGASAQAYVRHVELSCAGRPVVFARTVIPRATLATQQRLTRLRNRSLGDVLFADPRVTRGEVSVALLRADHATLALAQTKRALWGRRSVFYFSGAPLLVSEFFLDVP